MKDVVAVASKQRYLVCENFEVMLMLMFCLFVLLNVIWTRFIIGWIYK